MPRSDVQVFHVTEDLSQLTLVTLLRHWMPGESWSRIRKLLQGRHVQVNGNLCLDEGRRLKAADVVRVLESSQSRPPTQTDVKIRYLDPHIAIIEKPAGMTTLRHIEEKNWPARRKQVQPTLDEVLPGVIAQFENFRPKKGQRLPRIRAVHRLDRETSGLMIFARTPEAEQKLVQMFRKHELHRQYVAFVQGHLEAQTIESDLVRDRGDGKRGSTTLKDVGQHAVTHVRPIEHLDGYTIVECRLETGRTHQIRIHLSEKGHVLCGEKVYHTPLFQKAVPDHSGAPRIALHAAELGLTHPITGEKLHFKMPLPPDMAELLTRLRNGRTTKTPAHSEFPVQEEQRPPTSPKRPQADTGGRPSKNKPYPHKPRSQGSNSQGSNSRGSNSQGANSQGKNLPGKPSQGNNAQEKNLQDTNSPGKNSPGKNATGKNATGKNAQKKGGPQKKTGPARAKHPRGPRQ